MASFFIPRQLTKLIFLAQMCSTHQKSILSVFHFLQKVQVLQALDARRKDMFKQHEMGIEAKRREKLKKMTERDRLKAEEEFRKEAEARKAHHVPHPV